MFISKRFGKEYLKFEGITMRYLEKRRKLKPLQMKRIMLSVLINFLLCPTYFTLDDGDFDTFIAKTIMEDPWLNVSITEEEIITLTNGPSSTHKDAHTENYPNLDIKSPAEDLWPNENHHVPSLEILEKFSIIILQSNCSDIKEPYLSEQRVDVFNNTNLKDVVEDCLSFVSLKISDKKSTQEIITEIKKKFKNHVVVKIFEDVDKHEKISITVPSHFSDFSEVKYYYYIIGGIIISFLLLIIINFAVCSRKNRKNQSLDLSEIPHLTLATENFKMSIPRPTISSIHQNKNEDSVFSEYYQGCNSGNNKYCQDFQAFENVEGKAKRPYMNPDGSSKFGEWIPKKRQIHNSQDTDLLQIDKSAFMRK